MLHQQRSPNPDRMPMLRSRLSAPPPLRWRPIEFRQRQHTDAATCTPYSVVLASDAQRCCRTSREPVQREPVESTARHGVKARKHVSPGARTSARDIAARLAALLAFALVGCATPVMQPSLDVPGRFAAAPASDSEPEVAWWDGYGDPVLSDLVRRAARENRDVKIAAERVRAARAGETISRSWLFPSIGVYGAGFDAQTGYSSDVKQLVSVSGGHEGLRRAASTSPGKSTSPVACARAPRRPRPTRWRPKTPRGAFVCWS